MDVRSGDEVEMPNDVKLPKCLCVRSLFQITIHRSTLLRDPILAHCVEPCPQSSELFVDAGSFEHPRCVYVRSCLSST